MTRLEKLPRLLLASIVALQLSACSKMVEWKEEVPLNTGETIWVTRSVAYSLKGGHGNPFDIAYRQDEIETLSFKLAGKQYVYEGDAALMLLAVSAQGQPVLVAPAADKGWDWNHDYYCAGPHYVQFLPDVSGRRWTWPPEIEPWLYGLPHNLMRTRRKPEEMKARYTSEQRNEEDAIGSMQGPSRARVDPNHITKNCKARG